MEESHKTCTKCGETKPLSEFHRDSRIKDGRRADCKVCSREKGSRYYQAHAVEAREREKRRRIAKRDEIREQRRRYRTANREEVLSRNRAWAEANSDHLREYGRQQREDLRAQVFAHYGLSCACCGSTERLTIDHINGGGSQHRLEVLGQPYEKVAGTVFYRWLVENSFPDGFQTLCFPCNQSKHTGERCRIDHDERRRMEELFRDVPAGTIADLTEDSLWRRVPPLRGASRVSSVWNDETNGLMVRAVPMHGKTMTMRAAKFLKQFRPDMRAQERDSRQVP